MMEICEGQRGISGKCFGIYDFVEKLVTSQVRLIPEKRLITDRALDGRILIEESSELLTVDVLIQIFSPNGICEVFNNVLFFIYGRVIVIRRSFCLLLRFECGAVVHLLIKVIIKLLMRIIPHHPNL